MGGEQLEDGRPQFVQGTLVEGVVDLLAVPPRDDQPGALEDVEVVRHGRRGDVEAGGEGAGGLLSAPEEPQYLPPRGVGECLEDQIALLTP